MTARRATGPAGPSWTWQLLVPPGWTSLPVEDAEAGRAAARRLVDRALRGQPRDAVVRLRRSLLEQLRGALGSAREAGADQVWVQAELVRGLPVSASLLVARVPAPHADAVHSALHPLLTAAAGVVVSDATTLAGLPALRRRRDWVGPLPGADGGPEVPQTAVDYVLALPDDDELLLLSFGTLTPQVREELVLLFDAVAGTLELIDIQDPGPLNRRA